MTRPPAQIPGLIIFDCDGVLVDSEPIANRVLARALTAAGYPCTVSQSVARFVGLSLNGIIARVEGELGRPLPAGFAEAVQAETFAAFRAELQPVPGVAEALARIGARKKCVASSGDPEKIRLSLGLTGLLDRFEPDIFSARMVARGKPHPDLFLHAAQAMATRPEHCLVVEDSLPGVTAARAAGMRALGYAAGSHTGPDHERALARAGARTFTTMARLPDLIAAS